MTQTGNRLQNHPPQADQAVGDTPAPRTPPPGTRADARRRAGGASGPELRPSRPAGASRPRTRLSRRGVAVVLALGAALLTMVAVLVTGVMNTASSSAPPAGAQVVARTQAASVTFDATGGWLADDHAGTVRHFDPSSGAAIGGPLHLGGRPISVVSGFSRIWVADIAGSRVWEINPRKGRVVGPPIVVAQGPVSLAAGDGGVWVASLLAGTVSMIDPRTGQVRASATLPDGAVRIAIGPDGVWVSGQTDSLTRVDPRPVGVSLRWRAVKVGQGPIGVGVGDGSVWVANVKSGSVSRVDPSSVRVTATYTVGGAGGGVPANPEMVAVWHDRLWVADAQQGVVVALNPSTGQQIGGPVPLPGVIRQLVLDDGATLWGTTANADTVVRFSG